MKKMRPVRTLYLVLYYGLLWFAMVVVRLVVPIRVIGRKNLPRGRGFVLAPNHIRAIDPMYVLLARGYAKKMLVMGKVELFEINPVISFLLTLCGCFPVDRGTGNREVLDATIDEVKNGCRGLLLFPEGTRTKDGNLGRLKSGAFVIAMQAGVDMVPCRVWYKAGKPKAFHRTTIVYGQPVTLAQLGLEGEYSASKLREAKRRYAELLDGLYEDNKDKL